MYLNPVIVTGFVNNSGSDKLFDTLDWIPQVFKEGVLLLGLLVSGAIDAVESIC